MEADIASVHSLMDDLAQAQAQALNMAEEHKYRDAIAKKLDSLVALEEAAVASIRARMLTKVKAEVIKTFSKDAAAKERALEQAVAVLKAGAGGKMGKDVVGDAYVSSLKAYKEQYAKLAPGSDEILVQLEKVRFSALFWSSFSPYFSFSILSSLCPPSILAPPLTIPPPSLPPSLSPPHHQDIAAASAAPTIEFKGGNVYETHPVIAAKK